MKIKKLLFLLLIPLVSCAGGNIIVLDSGSAIHGHNPCEPSIAISLDDTRNIVAGSIIDNFYYSNNTGKSWKKGKLKSSLGVWGDPVLISDSKGNFYYFHLSDPTGKNWQSEEILDRIVCQKSTDNGQTYNDGTFTGFNHPKDQDKHWAISDPKNDNIYLTWTQFDKYGSEKSEDKSNIMFSMSADQGETWSEAIMINQKSGNCLDDDETTEGAVPAVGPNGELYVAWSYNDTVWFDRSLDEGKTWLDKDKAACEQIGGWDMHIPGLYRANGMPVTVCDQNSGEIYICFADQRNGENDTDIWLVKSSDRGDTWSDPMRINDDPPAKQQFLPWISIDQNSGTLYAVFYDRRAHNDLNTDVYLAWSKDKGKTFTNEKINDKSFEANPNIFFGDYNNISSHRGIIAPIWTESNGFNTSVKTRIIKVEELGNLKLD